MFTACSGQLGEREKDIVSDYRPFVLDLDSLQYYNQRYRGLRRGDICSSYRAWPSRDDAITAMNGWGRWRSALGDGTDSLETRHQLLSQVLRRVRRPDHLLLELEEYGVLSLGMEDFS